jgi:hypothetical protein
MLFAELDQDPSVNPSSASTPQPSFEQQVAQQLPQPAANQAVDPMPVDSHAPSQVAAEEDQGTVLLQQLEQERAAHSATKQALLLLEGKYAGIGAEHTALLDRHHDLVQSSEEQISAYRELEKAHAALQQELEGAKKIAAEAQASTEAFKAGVTASMESAAAAANQDESSTATPSSRELQKMASLRLQELQHERDSLAAQLAALTAKASFRLSRTSSSREGSSSGGSIATGSSGGASSAQTQARESGSGAETPSSASAYSRGSPENEESGSNHLADLLEGLQQLHVLTEDMVEAAEQVRVVKLACMDSML